MVEVSNRVLAALLVVAIIVSIGGTMISLQRIRGIQFVPMTGFAMSGPGYVYINVTSVAAVEINATTQAIDFRSGYVAPGTQYTNCTMWINGTVANPQKYPVWATHGDRGCRGDWNNTWWNGETPIMVLNVGTTLLNINITSNKDDTELLGSQASNLELFEWWFQDDEANSCNTFEQPSAAWKSWQNVSKTTYRVCRCLNYSVDRNSLALGAKVRVPYDILPSYLNARRIATWTVSATQLLNTCAFS